MLIAYNGTREFGQFLGDQLCSLKMAWLWAQNYPCSKIYLACSHGNEMHFLFTKFIETFNVEVIYDTLNPGDDRGRFEMWTRWFKERTIEGRSFDVYKELHRRIDGSKRQALLCGGEKGLGRRNIFEYFWHGQEHVTEPILHGDTFDDTLTHHPQHIPERGVLIAPHAKCQGNAVFTFEYWSRVVHRLIDSGVTVTINYNGNFCEDLNGHPLYRKIFPNFKNLMNEVCRHKIVACGNTGVGWLAAACGVPLLAMQPVNSQMPDYRYELCGLKSLVEIMDQPDWEYCARRLTEEVNRVVVFTTGCYDVIHSGHVRHLEESRALGTKLIVGLNSDASVKKLKGADRPVNNELQRADVLRALRFVDEVRVFDGDNALELIKEIKPDILTNGCDHNLGEVVGKDFVESYGGRAVITGGTRDQSSTAIIKVVRMADVLKAVNDASTVSPNPWSKLKLLADQFMTVSGIPGDTADVGCYRGACSLILRRLAPDKTLHIFDTFQGNPFDDPLCHHKRGEWVASEPQVRSFVGEGPRTQYHVGVFPSTAENLRDRMFCFVVVDPDTYQTVTDAIEFFWPRLVVGGKMFFDDYSWPPCSGVEKAVNEHFTEDQRMVFPSNYTCVVTKK